MDIVIEKAGLYIKETMMKHRCNIDETLMISMQTLKIVSLHCADFWKINVPLIFLRRIIDA